MLEQICRIDRSLDFVGLRFEDHKPIVYFPREYSLANNDDELRHDILSLLSAIKRFGNQDEGNREKSYRDSEQQNFPLESYLYIISDFLSNGYYSESEVYYSRNANGKVDWKKTIQLCKPYVSQNNVVYISPIVKRNKTNTYTLITKIHEYCVYLSFLALGWLYYPYTHLPKKPSITFNRQVFTSVINTELKNTFNIKKKQLFNSMLNIINSTDGFLSSDHLSFGVEKFQYVWQGLIDYVYGEDNKDDYFPHAKWTIVKNGFEYQTRPLQPDTIMLFEDIVYILDAKYYRFGTYEDHPEYLPGSDSIQKQITYGDYVHVLSAKGKIEKCKNVINAFIMPFCRKTSQDEILKFVSVGTADWREDISYDHEYVLGILLDMKHLVNSYYKHNNAEIERLALFLQHSLEEFKE